MDYKSPTGLFDIVPTPNEEWRSSHIWQYVEKVMRSAAREWGFDEIRTPIFERADLFMRTSGDTSDIVSKEMYLFEDKKGRKMALKPEGTAPVMRSIAQNKEQHAQKLFYISPMFRYDRPQAGRYRQHHQFGVEAIGAKSPEQDAEVIALLVTLYKRLGLRNLTVHINSLGDKACRDRYRDSLKTYLEPHLNDLSKDSQKRFAENPLRILDSKETKDQELLTNAPSILDFLSDESRTHLEMVQTRLASVDIDVHVSSSLVRGLDYYNEVVFEIVAGELGAQNSIGGGGRYDGLLKSIGGSDLPAFGFGTGIERIIQTMIAQNVNLPSKPVSDIFLVPLGEMATETCFSLIHKLRNAGISAEMELNGRKIGKAMNYANQIGARYSAVIGDKELQSKIIPVKNMQTGETNEITVRNLYENASSWRA